PGLERRGAVGRLSLPLQTAGSEKAARHLRAVPAALRLEPLVRLARRLHGEPVRPQLRGAAPRELAAGAAPLRRESVRGEAAGDGARGQVAVLVHDAGRARADGGVVESQAHRPLHAGDLEMNYLAHLFLGGDDAESMIGSLAGDFVKGPIRGSDA